VKNKIWVILFVLIGILSGFGMEWIKIEVNWLLKTADQIPGFYDLSYEQRVKYIDHIPASRFYDYYNNHKHIDVFNHLSKNQLVYFKWISTVMFCIVFFLLCNAILTCLCIALTIELRWLYAVSFLFALFMYMVGKLASVDFYPFARLVIGFLQSLIPAAIFVLISFIKNHE